MAKLYEYAVMLNGREGEDSKLLIPPTPIVAKDEAHVRKVATRKLSPEYDDKLDQVEILLRPF